MEYNEFVPKPADKRMDKHTSPKYLLSLTEREQEVLALIGTGLSNNAIAEQLVLSHHTVAWYAKQIFNKLGVSRRTQAVAVARSLGLLDEPTPAGDSPKSDSRYRMRHNLPPQPTSFIGREDEIAEIAVLLDDPSCRLLTLVGPGGSGKTRLGIEVAARKLDEFANGVFIIALQPLTSHEDIVPTIASSLGVQLRPDGRNPQQQLFDYFRNKSVLLLMDNFEHLLAGAKVLCGLLSAAPGVRVLATSRESLNLREEHLYNVGGLQFPDHDQITSTETFSAIELFAERARRVYPDFSLTDELPDVVRICQLVGGMPLALELAASWLKTLSCAEIAAEIQWGLDILATPLRNVPERHRSMQAVFDYSWQLLSEKERATFRRLSVFRGGCTHEAARQVAGADLRVLQALADKSFIHREPHSGHYDIHELLRQYGEWHLEQSAEDRFAVYDLHCEYYADLLGKYRDDVSNHRQRNMMQELELELDNIRAAWRWAVDHRKVDEIQKALHTFAYFHVFRSRFLEEAYALEAAIHRLDSGELGGQWGVVLAALLSYCGWIYVRVGRYEQAEVMFQRSRTLYQRFNASPPPGWGTEPLTGLSLLASILGDYV
jgi:predicted ATPase/DNA-binding CsgD family transcriptional regulator